MVLGGTRITTRCCEATKFDDDDAIAIDLSDICNSGTSLQFNVLTVISAALVAAFALIRE